MKQNLARTFLLMVAVSASVWLCRAGSPSGSLFPYCYQKGKAYVLLGELSGGGGSRWSCLGGKQDRGESLFDTALREGSEESKLVYGRTNSPGARTDAASLVGITKSNFDALLKKSMNYFGARVQPSLHGKFTDPDQKRGFEPAYVVFVEVDYIPEKVFTAASTIEDLNPVLRRNSREIQKKQHAISEVKDFHWFPLGELNDLLRAKIGDRQGYGPATEIEHAEVKYTIRGPTVWDFSLPGFQAMVKEILSKEAGAKPQAGIPAAPLAKVDIATLGNRLQALQAELKRLRGQLQAALRQ